MSRNEIPAADESNEADLEQAARRWLALDPDPATAEAIRAMLAELDGPDPIESRRTLERWFDGRISFGTAGLRAAVGPGPRQMNRLVVRQTTAGLMTWLQRRVPSPLVVIGHDHRHGSTDFAADIAGVVAAAGGRAELLPEPLPTPVLAHLVLDRGADAGIMITASHNPPQDNGYKLYLADGIQLVSPADAEIAAEIAEFADTAPEVAGPDHRDIVVLGPEAAARHLDAAVAAVPGPARAIRTVYTAMHGVGGRHLLRAFDQAGFAPPILVDQQFDPDPDFPTVDFPNPEEPGALDLALARAVDVDADLVLANDPDADRLAVAVPAREGQGFTALSGDQLGCLLADHLLREDRLASAAKPLLVSSSIVSSRLLGAIARARGVEHVETLTGFKWVARPIVDRPDHSFVLGYEEAIGYCVGDRVRDKDGISAALVAAEMVADAMSRGETLWDRLDRLDRTLGIYRSGPVTIRLDLDGGMARAGELLAEITTRPPAELAGSPLATVRDLSVGGPLAPTPGLVLVTEDDSRVIVRPSGTEPKLKAYLEVFEPVESIDAGSDAAVHAARERAEGRLSLLQQEIGLLLDR